MPLYEFGCESCGASFEALVAGGATAPCAACGSERTRRRWSPVAPMTSPLGLTRRRAAASDAYRREREERREAGLPPDPPGKAPPYPTPQERRR